jgi:hypothetical protein
MRPSRKRIVEAFQDLNESELRAIVQTILEGPNFIRSEEGRALLAAIDTVNEDVQLRSYGLRGVTGRKAEEYFINYHTQTGEPHPGQLSDTRDQGIGYDFHIISGTDEAFVEVKGLSGEVGGISFTDKDVRSLLTTPQIQFIQNPGKHLTVSKDIFTVVQVQWSAWL